MIRRAVQSPVPLDPGQRVRERRLVRDANGGVEQARRGGGPWGCARIAVESEQYLPTSAECCILVGSTQTFESDDGLVELGDAVDIVHAKPNATDRRLFGERTGHTVFSRGRSKNELAMQ